MEERYVLIDVYKMTNGIIELIGERYGIKPDEENVHWGNEEGYDRYLDKIVDYLREETKKILGQEKD